MKMKWFGILVLLIISSAAQAQLMKKIKTRSGGGDPANPTSASIHNLVLISI